MDTLTFSPALTRPDLLADPVREVLHQWSDAPWLQQVQVAQIDPDLAAGRQLCERYGLDPSSGGVCLIVEARRGTSPVAACLVPVGTRCDVNGRVRAHLQAGRVSLLDAERAVADSRMEQGSITVLGLPQGWPVLVDATLVSQPELIIGSGLRRSKLKLPPEALLAMTGAVVVDGLGQRPPASRGR